jgi:rod shape determining protein RodA
MVRTSNAYRKGVDWITVLIYGILVIFGWLNIYAANFNPETQVFFTVNGEYFKQLVWIGISWLFAFLIMQVDSKFFVEISYVFYGIAIFLCFMVILFGREVNGAKSWFELGPIRFQPVELAKVATALVVARIMSRYGFTFEKRRNWIRLGLVLLVPIAVLLLQNDTGSALVFFVFLLAFYREGMSPWILILGIVAGTIAILTLFLDTEIIILCYSIVIFVFLYLWGVRRELLIAIAAGVVTALLYWIVTLILSKKIEVDTYIIAALAGTSIYLLYRWIAKRRGYILLFLMFLWGGISLAYTTDYFFDNVLSPHQRTRINVLFGLEEDPLGAGYNVNQSKIAIGSGGFSGKGFLEGTQTKFNFVPEQTTDFIFCTIGEEWGFIGSSLLVILFLVLMIRIIILAEKQHSVFSRVYGYCVAGLFFFHFMVNIGMTIGLFPVIGIPLPFFSYGGSSLWSFTFLLFVFLKLDTNRNELIR